MSKADEVRAWLVNRLSAILDLPPARVHDDTTFDELGLDSLSRAGFSTEIAKQFGVSLDPDTLFEFSSIQVLARHVADNAKLRLAQ
jgi:acyl carrier protein